MRFERLGDIAKITSGGTPSTAVAGYYKDGTIPWVKTGDLKVRHLMDVPDKITQLGLENSSAKIFPVNTVLIAMYGATIGACSILKTEAATNQACAAILPNDKINEEFLYFYLAFIKPKLVRMGMGGGQPNISATILKALKVPVPSMPDQIKIANLLSRAETLLTQRRESLKLLDAFVESTFYEMFGDPSSNQHQFEVGRIGDLASDIKYGTSKSSSTQGQYPYLRMNNVTSNGYWDFSQLKYIDIDENEKDNYLARKGDLIFNRTNSKELVGKTAVFEETADMILAGYLIRLRANDKSNPWYLWGYLNSSHGKRTLFNMCKSIVGMANINAQELSNIRVLIPPINVQNKFADIVRNCGTLRRTLFESLAELGNLFKALNQKVFSDDFDLDSLPFLTTDLSHETPVGIEDELDITIIKTEPPKEEQKTSPYQTLKPIVGNITGYKPKAEDLLPFIQQNFREAFFTFASLKEKAVESGWAYDFEQLKTYVFDLLREGKLKQVFTDAVFEERMRTTNNQYQKPAELTEKLHLQRAIEL